MKLSAATLNKTIRNPQWLEQHADYLRSVFPSNWTPITQINTNKVRILNQLYAIGITTDYTDEQDAIKAIAMIMSEFNTVGFIQRGQHKEDGFAAFRINPQFGNTIELTA